MIMTVADVLKFGIIISVGVFGLTLPDKDSDKQDTIPYVNLDQFLGIWYFEAQVTYLSSIDDHLKCVEINVTKKENDGFDELNLMIDDKLYIIDQSKTTIHDGAIHIKGFSKSDLTNDSIEIIHADNKDLLVVHENNEPNVTMIYSRHANISNELFSQFKTTIGIKRPYFEYFDSRQCNPESLIQYNEDQEFKKRFLGRWNLLLELCPEMSANLTPCAVLNVTKQEDNFKTSTIVSDVKKRYVPLRTMIFNRQLHFTNNHFDSMYIFSMDFHNDDNEVLIHGKKPFGCYRLWSKNTNNSNESLEKYKEKIVENNKGLVLKNTGALDNCTYTIRLA